MEERHLYPPANCFIKPAPPNIVVNQVLGQQDINKVIDICLVVPGNKPAIEQVVDVFVKRLCITDVELLPHKVVVRGSFEVKALYVACLPSQPVHAVQARHVRFTAAAHIPGCHHGLEADAHAVVEYIDYTAHRWPFHRERASGKKPKWKTEPPHHYGDYDDHWGHHHDDCKPHHYDDCDHGHHHDDCGCDHHHHDDCGHYHHGDYDHHDDCGHHDKDCKPKPHPKPHKPDHGCRQIDVSVVLRIRIKVTKDREIFLHPVHPVHPVHHIGGQFGQLPLKPKG